MRSRCWLAAAAVAVAAGVWGVGPGLRAESTGASAPAASWFQHLGPNRDNISQETGWLDQWGPDGPKVLWKANVGAGYSAFSVGGNRAYTMGNAGGQDTVYCLNADTGEVVWKQSYPCRPGDHPGPRCTPTLDGDRVYTLGYEGQLCCFDAADGRPIWSKRLPQEIGAKVPGWGLSCSPLVLGEALVVDAGVTAAFDKKTGSLLWKSEPFKPGYSSPIAFKLNQKQCLAVFNGMGLVVLDAAGGQTMAKFPWKTEYDVNAAVPIISGDQIFISSGYGAGCALLKLGAEGLSVVWRNKDMRNHFSTCVLWKGCLYGIDGNVGGARLRCLDFATGAMKWDRPVGGMGSLMLADGKLIVLSDSGVLTVGEASPDGFKETSRAKVHAPTCWTAPVLSGGRIFCRNEKGAVVCVDVKGK